MSLLDKLAATKAKGVETKILSKSSNLFERDVVSLPVPILNAAFSGRLDGGLVSGLTVVAGESKTFKTLLSLVSMKAYMDKYPDAVVIFYDSEWGATPEYFESFGIDTDRVIRVEVTNIEELTFDIVKKLKEIEKKDRVFIMIDSVGNLASLKEVNDAEAGESKVDMTRAKTLKSLFRIITPILSSKGIPCIAIGHTYQTLELYSKAVVSGGTGIMYSANQVFIITKAQEKEKQSDKEISGWKFTVNIEKSRFVKEKSKLPFVVKYKGGIQKYSGLFDLALESGDIAVGKQGWYHSVDLDTGEVSEVAKRRKEFEDDEVYMQKLIETDSFKKFVEEKYKLSGVTYSGSEDDNDNDKDFGDDD